MLFRRRFFLWATVFVIPAAVLNCTAIFGYDKDVSEETVNEAGSDVALPDGPAAEGSTAPSDGGSGDGNPIGFGWDLFLPTSGEQIGLGAAVDGVLSVGVTSNSLTIRDASFEGGGSHIASFQPDGSLRGVRPLNTPCNFIAVARSGTRYVVCPLATTITYPNGTTHTPQTAHDLVVLRVDPAGVVGPSLQLYAQFVDADGGVTPGPGLFAGAIAGDDTRIVLSAHPPANVTKSVKVCSIGSGPAYCSATYVAPKDFVFILKSQPLNVTAAHGGQSTVAAVDVSGRGATYALLEANRDVFSDMDAPALPAVDGGYNSSVLVSYAGGGNATASARITNLDQPDGIVATANGALVVGDGHIDDMTNDRQGLLIAVKDEGSTLIVDKSRFSASGVSVTSTFSISAVAEDIDGRIGISGRYGPAGVRLGDVDLPAGQVRSGFVAHLEPNFTLNRVSIFKNANVAAKQYLTSPAPGQFVLGTTFLGTTDFGSGPVTSATGGTGVSAVLVSSP